MRTYTIKTVETETPGNLGNFREVTIHHGENEITIDQLDEVISGEDYVGGVVNCADDDAPYDIHQFREALEKGELNGTYELYDECEWQKAQDMEREAELAYTTF